jgi:hypothetical protein
VVKALIVALGLARLASCAGFLAALPDSERFAVRSRKLPVGTTRVVAFDSDLLVTAGEASLPDELRWIEHRPAADPPSEMRFGSIAGEGAASAGARGPVYSVVAAYKNGWGVLFADEERRFVPLPLMGPGLWLPVAGDEPRGLYVSLDGQTAHVQEVAASGPKRDWVIPEQLVLQPGRWSAQAMANGSLALVSLEGEAEAHLILRRLWPDRVDEVPLRAARDATRIATAASADGRLAIADWRSP